MDRHQNSSGSADNLVVASLARERAWPAMSDCLPKSNLLFRTPAKQGPLYEVSRVKHRNGPYRKGNDARDGIE